MRALPIAALVAGLVLVVTAGSDAALTPSAYRAQANAVCAKTKVQLRAATAAAKGNLGRYMERFVPISRAELAALRKLEPPAGLRDAHARALRLFKRELYLIASALGKVHAGADPNAALGAVAKQGTKLGNAEEAAWRQAGVKDC